jgi:hypothetical protein
MHHTARSSRSLRPANSPRSGNGTDHRTAGRFRSAHCSRTQRTVPTRIGRRARIGNRIANRRGTRHKDREPGRIVVRLSARSRRRTYRLPCTAARSDHKLRMSHNARPTDIRRIACSQCRSAADTSRNRSSARSRCRTTSHSRLHHRRRLPEPPDRRSSERVRAPATHDRNWFRGQREPRKWSR